MDDAVYSSKRRFIRAEPDLNQYAQIDPNVEGDFSFVYAALIVEESPLGGCSIVCLESLKLAVDDIVRIKVGNMAPLKAEIVWSRPLDDQVVRCGIKFLE
ncbi:MAG: hypothetical protein HRU19_05440 [Pseudobacteriovorax sp.]|nr:hypothetical protein [Pseudobacteriovorax sp.]